MKNIYLETDEEITSVIDKIREAGEREVFLIFPKEAALTRSLVNLKLLKSQAESLRVKIILVTQDATSRNLAEKAGIPCGREIKKGEVVAHEKIKEEEKMIEGGAKKEILAKVHEKMEKKDEKEEKELKKVSLMPRRIFKILVPIILVFVLIFGFFAFFVLPKAEIKIVPKVEKLTGEVDLLVDGKIDKVDFEKNIIPGKMEVRETYVPKMKFEVKGEKEIGDKAKGEIIVLNKYSSLPQSLPKETKFEKEGKVFLSQENVEVPGAKIEEGKTVPGQTSVKVQAERGGEEYNLGPSIFVIASLPADLQKDIWGENRKDFSGGKSKKIKALSEGDLKRAREAIGQEGARMVLNEAKKVTILPESVLLDQAAASEVMEAKTETKIDEEAVNFEMEGKVKVWFMIFENKKASDLIFKEVEKKIGSERFIVDIGQDAQIRFETRGFDFKAEKLILKAKSEFAVAKKFNEEELKKQLFGLNKSEAKDKLLNNPEIEDATLIFWPFWINHVPKEAKKIKISLDTAKITDKIKKAVRF